jgi:diguanylate cyclase (GGDEF)-like protein
MADKVAELNIREELGTRGGWKSNFLGAIESDDKVKSLKKENRELKRSVETDSLTGLPNEIALEKELIRLSLIRDRYVDKENEKVPRGTIIVADLTKLKFVNDRLGRSFGDIYLKAVARSLEESLRPEDFLSRIGKGADEFVMILPDLVEEDDINKVEDRIEHMIKKRQQELPDVEMGVSFVAGRFGIPAPASYVNLRVLDDLGEAKSQKSKENKRGESIGRIIAC